MFRSPEKPSLKKLLISVAGILVLLVAAVLVAPSFIDWNARKEQITAAVRNATGRDLKILGDIDVTILPNPAIRVVDVRFANAPGAASSDMVRLNEARVSVAFGPLFEGRLAAVVALVKPEFHLERLKDGRTSWDFILPGKADGGAKTETKEKPASAPFFDLTLDRFEIVDGKVTYYDAGEGTVQQFDKLNSTVSFETLAGPFRFDGAAVLGNLPLSVQLVTGKLRPKLPLPVSLTLAGPDKETVARIQGSVTALAADGSFVGELRIDSADFATFLRSVGVQSIPAALSRPLTLRTELTASNAGIGLNTIDLDLGNARASGTVTLEIGKKPRLVADLRSSNLNLDALFAAGKKPAKQPASPSPVSPSPAAPAAGLQAATAAAFSVPAGFEAAVQLTADVVQYRGSVIRQAAMRARLKDSKIFIDELGATLPGNTLVGAKGHVAASLDPGDIDLRLSAESDNLREIFEWLGTDISAVPADRLRRFKFSSALTGTTRELTAKSFEVTLDSSRMSGGVVLALRKRPAFGLRLVVDRFNLDGYLPSRQSGVLPRTEGKRTADANGKATRKSAKSPPANDAALMQQLAGLLRRFDANVDVRVNRLIVAKTPVRDLRLDFTIANGVLDIRKASVSDYAGLRGNLRGKLRGNVAKPTLEMTYKVELRDRTRFARLLGNPSLFRDFRLASLTAGGRIAGTPDRLTVRSSVAGLDGKIEIKGSVRNALFDPVANLTVAVNFPELAKVVRSVAKDYSPAAGKLGVVDLTFQAEGTSSYLKLNGISGTIGPISLRGNADFEMKEARPRVRLSLSTSEVLLDLLLPPERHQRTSAPVGERVVPAAATVRRAQASGKRWPTKRIDFSALKQVDLDVNLAMAALTKGPYQFKHPQIQAQLLSGKLSVNRFEAGFSSGTVSASGSLEPGVKDAKLSLQAAAKSVDAADLIQALRNYQMRIGPLRVGARVGGPISLSLVVASRGRSERELVSRLHGSAKIVGRPSTVFSGDTKRASAVTGLAGALLGKNIRELRAVGNVAQATNALIAAFEGPSSLNGDIDIKNGVASTKNLVLVGRGGRALTAGSANLPMWKLDTVTDVTLGQEKEPLIIVRMIGPLDEPYVRKLSGSLITGRVRPATQAVTPKTEPATPPQQQKVLPDSKPGKRLDPQEILRQLLQGAGR